MVMVGTSRAYSALGLFSLGYFVSEAVRVFYRRRTRPKRLAATAYVCDEWALTLETAREMDEAGGLPSTATPAGDDVATQLTRLAELALSTVQETAKAVQALTARGGASEASHLTRLCERALADVAQSARRIGATRSPLATVDADARSPPPPPPLPMPPTPHRIDFPVEESSTRAILESLESLDNLVSSDLETASASPLWSFEVSRLREMEASSDDDDDDSG